MDVIVFFLVSLLFMYDVCSQGSKNVSFGFYVFKGL